MVLCADWSSARTRGALLPAPCGWEVDSKSPCVGALTRPLSRLQREAALPGPPCLPRGWDGCCAEDCQPQGDRGPLCGGEAVGIACRELS